MRIRLSRLLAVPLAFFGPLALSHVDFVRRGVHFKGGGADFGLPPKRYAQYWLDYGSKTLAWRPGTDYLGDRDYGDWEAREARKTARVRQELRDYRRARNREVQHRYSTALSIYRGILAEGRGDVARVRRHIEILKAVGCVEANGLSQLLKADSIVNRDPTRRLPEGADPRLSGFVDYLRADRLREAGKGAEAGKMLYASARKAPRAPYAEEMLITSARCLLEGDAEPTSNEFHIADASIRMLMREYPKSRFLGNAYAWLGRIDYLKGRTAAAIHHYRQWLSHSADPNVVMRVYESIALCYQDAGRPEDAAAWYLKRYVHAPAPQKEVAMSDFQGVIETFRGVNSRKFWRLLHEDQALLGAYVDYRLDYTDITLDLLHFGGSSDRSRLSSHVQASLADASLRLGKPLEAHRYAASVLARHPQPDDRDKAHFVLGTLAFRKLRLNEARSHYRAIVDAHPKGYLAGGARENLAIIAERTGRLEEALELYDDLQYDDDFAYLADARIPLNRLAAYTRRPNARRKPVLIYTLGMRYLRVGDWRHADQTFSRLSRKERRGLTAPPLKYGEWLYGKFRDEGGLQDPRSTLEALRRLDKAVKRARGNEAKAQAMLTLADYYYTHRYLLLYSVPLWKGFRTNDFAFSWNSDIATPADDNALLRHHTEHECLAHTLAICQDIVRKYPGTKAAYHAAYRGGCAAERLSNMAPYWRWQDQRQNLMGQSMALLGVARRSPEKQVVEKATKYATVFANEQAEKRQAFAEEKSPKRRWDPSW